MKKTIYMILALAACVLTGCKTDNFQDWKAMNQQWLEQNKDRQIVYRDSTYRVQETATGLQYIVIADPTPTDAKPSASSTVVLNYQLCLIHQVTLCRDAEGRDSIKFNPNIYIDKRTWSEMSVSNVISGFAEGLKKVHNNGDIMLFIPYDLGYGPNSESNGMGTEGGSSFIPPYSTLIFNIHVCGVN